MAHAQSRYGWIPDLPDQRDRIYAAPLLVPAVLPRSVDLRPHCPPVYDQGRLGSCTANGIGAALQFERMKQQLSPNFIPSRLFIYYNERVMEHTVDSDSGAQIRDGIKSVARQGDCPEHAWPYDIVKFAEQPPPSCYQEALRDRAVSYQRLLQSLAQMKGCLAAGYPFVFGFSVYESFESPQVAQSGRVPMPQTGERLLGGHCMLATGYDDERERFIVRNSWGKGWGKEGYCSMPYDYLAEAHLAADFWTIRLVSE